MTIAFNVTEAVFLLSNMLLNIFSKYICNLSSVNQIVVVFLAAHRNQSFPHAARKPLLSAMKRKDSKESHTSQSFDTTSPASTATGTPVTSPQKSLSIREESHEEAMLSERAGHSEPHSDSSDTDERRVQFNKAKFQIEPTGENIIEEMEIADDGTEEKEKKKHKG